MRFLHCVSLLLFTFLNLGNLKKVMFTNVAMLEKVKLQSRKSALLKKWLVLLSRLGIIDLYYSRFCKTLSPCNKYPRKTRSLHHIS